jgi:hypothetical protein
MRLVPPVPLRSIIRGVLFVVLTTGCSGERGIIVRGKVVKNGQPLAVQSGDTVAIYFVSAGEGQRTRSLAIYHVADGTFVCEGPNGTGIPKGRHRIEMWPARADLPPYNDYLFNGEFRGDRSPLEVTLTEANSRNVVIDVGAKTVTAP